MPELPEVETTKASLEPLVGAQVLDVSITQTQLRWQVATQLEQLIGKYLLQVRRRAKYLILSFAETSDASNDTQQIKLIIHLGMSGSLQQYATNFIRHKHDHVVFALKLTDGRHLNLGYHDPRRFGAILWYEDYADKLLCHLGPEPLSSEFSASYLKSHAKNSKRPIKSMIMDQTCVVGVGNIYATESLFLAGIHPNRQSSRISMARLEVLCQHIKNVLSAAIVQGGSTLRDYRHHDGKTGYFQQQLLVYGRAGRPCRICEQPLKNIKINNRASVYCPKCQT